MRSGVPPSVVAMVMCWSRRLRSVSRRFVCCSDAICPQFLFDSVATRLAAPCMILLRTAELEGAARGGAGGAAAGQRGRPAAAEGVLGRERRGEGRVRGGSKACDCLHESRTSTKYSMYRIDGLRGLRAGLLQHGLASPHLGCDRGFFFFIFKKIKF